MADTVASAIAGGAMANTRMKERFELALDAKQVIAVLLGSLVILGGVFVLGVSVGRQAFAAVAQPVAAPKDALARLDEPLPAREEAPPELKAHQALTDARSIDQMLPVPQVKATTVAIAPAPPPAPGLEKVTAAEPQLAATAVVENRHPLPPVRRAEPVARREPVKKRVDPAPKRGAYAIQIGSVPRRADAERLARQVAPRHPRIVPADVPGKGRFYRVLVGAFESRDAARRQLASLTRSGIHGIVTATR
jgi:DedD protein